MISQFEGTMKQKCCLQEDTVIVNIKNIFIYVNYMDYSAKMYRHCKLCQKTFEYANNVWCGEEFVIE